MLAAAAGIAAAWKASAEHGLVVTTYQTESPSRVPVVVVANRGPSAARPFALLVHGFQCNKSMMLPLAKHLARQGIDAYAVDLPGHGASLERFSHERAGDAVREALEAILAARKGSRDRVLLVGHSYGANVLARITGDAPGHRTTVMLGPSYGGGLSPENAGNLLVLTAEREPPHITSSARDMLRDATGGTLNAAGELSGELSRGDARAWQIVPTTDHLSLLLSADALERTSSWLTGSLRVASSAGGPEPSSAVAFAVLALAAAVALARALIATGSGTAAGEAQTPVTLSGSGWLAAVWFIALAVAVLVGRQFTFLAALRLLDGERIASLLAVAGVSMVALGWRLVPRPCASQIVRGLPITAAAFAIVYLGTVLSTDSGIYRVSLARIAPERYSAAIVLAAALSPFFAFTGSILDRVRTARGGGVPGALLAGAATVALCGAVSAAVYLVDHQLGRFAGPFGAVCLFAMAVGALLTQAARSYAVGVMFSSTVTAWVIAVGFVRY